MVAEKPIEEHSNSNVPDSIKEAKENLKHVIVEIGIGEAPCFMIYKFPLPPDTLYIACDISADIEEAVFWLESKQGKPEGFQYATHIIEENDKLPFLKDESVNEIFLNNLVNDPNISIRDLENILEESKRVLVKQGTMLIYILGSWHSAARAEIAEKMEYLKNHPDYIFEKNNAEEERIKELKAKGKFLLAAPEVIKLTKNPPQE